MVNKTYPEFSSHYPLLLTTLMKRPVKVYPNEVGVVYRNHVTGKYYRFTWIEWYKRTCRLANVLKALDVKPGKAGKPGDRVATMALNTHRHLELYYGVPCSGALLHPINIRLAQDHIIFTVNHSEDKIIFFDDVLLPLVESIYDKIKNTVEKFVYMSDKPGLPDTKIANLYEYEVLLKQESDEFEWPYLSEDNYATLCYTTGTTGLPKGAIYTHRALYIFTLHMIAYSGFQNDPTLVHLGENSIPLMITPLYHIHAWGAPFFYVFLSQKIVLPGTFTVDGFCELVQNEKVTTVAVVPTILALLLEYEDIDKYDLSSLVQVSVGGGALPLGLKDKIEKKIPGFTARSGYGMTETAPTTVGAFVKKYMRDWSKEKLDEVRVKTGLPIPGLEVDVVDENGNSVPHDDESIGQIVIRGPWIMEKYYKNPEKTAEVWYDEWFHTGDVAKVDEEDFIVIVDRMKDVIRSGAEMVPTVLLENLAAMADFILEATFVGVPDEVWGEKTMAIMKLVPNSNKKEEDLIKFLKTEGVDKGKITKWMLPKLVVIVDEIPRTSVGKFNKIEIRRNLDEFLAKAKEISTK
ncbi:MAG: long-chain-fatty-acid--CoA ligase [Candidatus Lokiarchaeota archaeon]|nr:long-chain-fatty-acid--CoA ligase [Candidatus Lokiarchaeota archaeon]